MIVRSGGRDVAVKSSSTWPEAWPYSAVPPSELVGGGLSGATRTHLEQAVGIPALLGVMYRLSVLGAGVPVKVYRGQAPARYPATDTWQYELLHDRPNTDGLGALPFYTDLYFSLAGAGYTAVRKWPSFDGKRIAELEPVDATKITPKRADDGRLVFDYRDAGKTETLDRRDIIYIRGPAMPGSLVGLSPIAAARLGLITALKRQLFEARWYDRNAQPGVLMAFPEKMPKTEAEAWIDMWDERHQGPENWHSTGAIGGGADVTVLPINLRDAQFVEANQFTAAQIGGMYGVTLPFLNMGENSPTAEDWRYLVVAALGWMLTAVAQAFTQDRDLFPLEPRPERRMLAEHVLDGLTRADMKTRYAAYKDARQAGWLTANEIRAKENEPPHPDGDELQATPVGGAPNDQGDRGGSASEEPPDDS